MEAYKLSTKEVLSAFSTSTKSGLTSKKADQLHQSIGYNELDQQKRDSPFVVFINQFKSFIIYILLFAVVISLVQKEFVDAIVILIILLVNAIIGFIQEMNAQKAIDSLKKLSGLQVEVLRDGKKITIPTKEVVPGDIMFLEEGKKVPADGRIIECSGLQISESSLTGESVPVSKNTDVLKKETPLAERKNMVFSGTLVLKGHAMVVVTHTGMKTEIGHIASMLSEVKETLTPLQKKLDVLGKKIGIATIIISIIILLAGMLTQGLFTNLMDGDFTGFIAGANHWLLLAVALAVAAVPEGLPAIVTIALSIGVKKMVKRNVLVRKLPSVETLGETTVICSDKTGTLTQNKMTVKRVFANNNTYEMVGEDVRGHLLLKNKHATIDPLLFKIGVLCNNASLTVKNKDFELTGDPTESSLLVSAYRVGVKDADLKKNAKFVSENPFDSNRKMMSVVYQEKKQKTLYVKGAPEEILKHATHMLVGKKLVKLDTKKKKAILSANNDFAKDALRVLGFAYKKLSAKAKPTEDKLVFVGLQGMIDPPRPEVKDSITTCKKAGVDVIMITGDNMLTAKAVAKEIGIVGDAISGSDFEKMNKKQQLDVLKTTKIFSRVAPAHKMLIVDLLQSKGEIVAMTGDGVNDAPAIKKADLGIAMGISGTDVAKESSDMILLDDNFTSIVSAVEEGRGIFTNIKKFVNYLLSCNLGEVFIIFFAVIVFGVESIPLTAIMLLWLNLVTDGLPALALSVDPNPKNLMEQRPEKSKSGIMTKAMTFNILYVSILITAGVLGLFELVKGEGIIHMQTMAFTAIIFFELIRVHTVRSEHQLGIFSNLWLIFAVLSSIGLQLLVVYTPLAQFFGTEPLTWIDWFYILISCGVIYLLTMLSAPLRHLFGIKD